MSLPGYDDWKLMTPEEDREERGGYICPFCGAYSTSQCEYEDDTETCPWEESQPDPDYLRDLRDEYRERFSNLPDDDF